MPLNFTHFLLLLWSYHHVFNAFIYTNYIKHSSLDEKTIVYSTIACLCII